MMLRYLLNHTYWVSSFVCLLAACKGLAVQNKYAWKSKTRVKPLEALKALFENLDQKQYNNPTQDSHEKSMADHDESQRKLQIYTINKT